MYLCVILGGIAVITAIASLFPQKDVELEKRLTDQLVTADQRTKFEEVLDFNHPSKFKW
jgi:hypothetical protein